ncbi:MAG: 6-pyruvoyl trahydropterin synthase family protein [Bacteroides sp.]
MLTITKEFHFSASHQLVGLEEGHPCGRVHGHNYILKIVLTGEVNKDGFIIDYRKLDYIKQWIDETLDHRHLNDIFDFQTSVENMSRYIYKKFKPELPQLKAIELSETPKTNCRYEE